MLKQLCLYFLVIGLLSPVWGAWNPCIKAKRQRKYRSLKLSSVTMNECLNSISESLHSKKHGSKAIELIEKILYVNNEQDRVSAILSLAASSNTKAAIKVLKKKGNRALSKNRSSDIKYVTQTMVLLKGYKEACSLALRAKRQRKWTIMKVIRDEYLLFAHGSHANRMIAIAGEGDGFD